MRKRLGVPTTAGIVFLGVGCANPTPTSAPGTGKPPNTAQSASDDGFGQAAPPASTPPTQQQFDTEDIAAR